MFLELANSFQICLAVILARVNEMAIEPKSSPSQAGRSLHLALAETGA